MPLGAQLPQDPASFPARTSAELQQEQCKLPNPQFLKLSFIPASKARDEDKERVSHPCCIPELGADQQDHSQRTDALSQLSGTVEVGFELCQYLGITQQKPAPKITMGKIISKPPTKWELQKQPQGIPWVRLQTNRRDSDAWIPCLAR